MKTVMSKLKVKLNELKKTTKYACFVGVSPWAIVILVAVCLS